MRLGDHCCFDGYVKYFAVYDGTLNASDVKVLYNVGHRRIPKRFSQTRRPSLMLSSRTTGMKREDSSARD